MKKGPHSDDSKRKLKSAGLKATPGRLEILSILTDLRLPLSADDISKKMRAFTVDRATVYRTLASLEKAGVIKKVDLHSDSDLFEMSDDHHHHLVCTDCGTIEDFEACDIEGVAKQALKGSGFRKVDSHSLELFGMCKKCSRV